MSNSIDRRGILRGLVTLPLIGGAVTLVGQPTASAEPLTLDLLENYHSWLNFEATMLSCELSRRTGNRWYEVGYDALNPGARFHKAEYAAWRNEGRDFASNRAAIVLGAVGCDWRAKRGGVNDA